MKNDDRGWFEKVIDRVYLGGGTTGIASLVVAAASFLWLLFLLLEGFIR